MNNDSFWQALDFLVADSKIIIDRPKGTSHPKYPNIVYELDYGYLKNTTSMDGAGIDVWIGSVDSRDICAVVCTVDLAKKDSEIKLLIGCTDEEMNKVYKFHNQTSLMKGLLIKR